MIATSMFVSPNEGNNIEKTKELIRILNWNGVIEILDYLYTKDHHLRYKDFSDKKFIKSGNENRTIKALRKHNLIEKIQINGEYPAYVGTVKLRFLLNKINEIIKY